MTDSCLIAAYENYVSLNERECDFLHSLERDKRSYGKGERIAEQGDDSTLLFVIASGWAHSQVCDAQGRCQILEVHLPGDVVGTREVAFKQRLSSLIASTDVEACPFPRTKLNELFDTSPRLTAVFTLISMRREAMLSERIFDLGRRDALARICHYVMEIRNRLCRTCSDGDTEVPQHLTQQQLADALGLTSVHVNRVVRKLREQNIADFNRDHVKILDMDALKQHARLNENYLEVDSSWVDNASFKHDIHEEVAAA